jgi:thiol-disulfide isomerase/thioredoxin
MKRVCLSAIAFAMLFFICGETLAKSKKLQAPVTNAGIDFELKIDISLFNFPCKVVLFQNNGSGIWDTTLTQVLPTGNGIIKGKLSYEDYVLLKIFPTDNPATMIATQKLFLPDGKSCLKWDTTANDFKVTGSKLGDAFLEFQKTYAPLLKAKAAAEEKGNQKSLDSIKVKSVDLLKSVFNGHKNDILGSYLLTTFLSHEADAKEFAGLNASLSNEMKNTGWGKNAQLILTLETGRNAPDFNVLTKESKQITLKEYKGKYVFIDFWASWCVPCMNELPYIEKLQARFDSTQLVIISISTDQSKEKYKEALAKHPEKWIQVLDMDNNKQLAKAYAVDRLPSNYLLNGKGEIVGKDLRGDELMRIVSGLISK